MAEEVYHESNRVYREVKVKFDELIRRFKAMRGVTSNDFREVKSSLISSLPKICIEEHRAEFAHMADQLYIQASKFIPPPRDFPFELPWETKTPAEMKFLKDLEGIGKRTLETDVNFETFLETARRTYEGNNYVKDASISFYDGNQTVELVFRGQGGFCSDQRLRM